MSQTSLRPLVSGVTTLLQRGISLQLLQGQIAGSTSLIVQQRGVAPALCLRPLQVGKTVIASAVTGPRGPSGEGIDNFDGDPLLVYRLYSGMPA